MPDFKNQVLVFQGGFYFITIRENYKMSFGKNNKKILSLQKGVLSVLVLVASLSAYAATGDRQSPVNIDTRYTKSAKLPVITPTYASNVTINVVNTYDPNRIPLVEKEWATVKANVPSGSFVMMGGKQYNLLQFHFHTPSEHKLNGKAAPMEVHFVHLLQGALPCDPEALLVIGARIQKSEHANYELNKIFSQTLPVDSTSGSFTVSNFNLNKVLPETEGSWRYSGSLTAPATFGTTCSAQGGTIDEQLSADIFPENVSWTVLTKSVGMSDKQIESFRKIFELGNSRVTQPLNGRVIQQELDH